MTNPMTPTAQALAALQRATITELEQANARITRLLAAADGLAEAVNRGAVAIDGYGNPHVGFSIDAGKQLHTALTAYQEARDGK